jgi:hypothetical protein
LIAAERAELLAFLAEDADEMVQDRAGTALLAQPLEGFLTALAGDAPAAQLFRYCGRNLIDTPEIATVLARHGRCPAEFVIPAAKRLPTSAVQELMGDLDRLSNSPLLVAALLHSASLTAEQRVQLAELDRDTPEGEAAFVESVAVAEFDPSRRISLIQRLSKMRVVERVQLALKGNREERIALIRDPCKVVQRAVLQSPRITDREVESFASMASLSDEVLRLISASRNFRRNYTVVRNLINNPKTPVDVSLHLLPAITPMDLKALALNKNVPETLRNAASRLQRQRTEKRD